MTRKKRFLCGFLSGCLMLFSAVGVFAAEPEPQEAALAAPELFVLSYAPHDPAQNEEGGKDITVSYLLSEETLLQLSEQKELRVQLDFAANENSFHTDEASYLTFDEGIQPLTQFSFGDIQTETTRSQLGEAYFSYKTQRSGSSRVTVWYLNEDVTLYARMRIVVAGGVLWRTDNRAPRISFKLFRAEHFRCGALDRRPKHFILFECSAPDSHLCGASFDS